MTEETEFIIDDDLKANWAFKKLAEDEQKLNELNDKRKSFLKQTNDWYESESSKVINNQDYLKHKLDEYRETLPDNKINVPAGKSSVRHTFKPVYEDEKVIDYVKSNHPDLLKYTYNKSDLKKSIKNVDGKAVDENGQIIDGITFEPRETVSFRLNKGDK